MLCINVRYTLVLYFLCIEENDSHIVFLHILMHFFLLYRHSPREIKVHYCYRFHAPDSDTYGVSWVDFTSEKLENYNWNYLDHYICMRGEGEFELKDVSFL